MYNIIINITCFKGDCMTQLKVPYIDTRDHLGRERFFTEPVESHTYPYNDMKIDPFLWLIVSSVYPTHFVSFISSPFLFLNTKH
jgi:hypothetical protein